MGRAASPLAALVVVILALDAAAWGAAARGAKVLAPPARRVVDGDLSGLLSLKAALAPADAARIGWPGAKDGSSPCAGAAPWPGVLCNKHGRVFMVDLSGLGLSGTLGDAVDLSSLSQLESLWLNGNRLAGSLPASLARLPRLKDVLVHDNLLAGPLPTALPPQLRRLHLSNNDFAGALPPAWASLTQLTELGLSGNLLDGVVPRALAAMSNLKILSIHDNPDLGGCLPWSNSKLRLDKGEGAAARGTSPALANTLLCGFCSASCGIGGPVGSSSDDSNGSGAGGSDGGSSSGSGSAEVAPPRKAPATGAGLQEPSAAEPAGAAPRRPVTATGRPVPAAAGAASGARIAASPEQPAPIAAAASSPAPAPEVARAEDKGPDEEEEEEAYLVAEGEEEGEQQQQQQLPPPPQQRQQQPPPPQKQQQQQHEAPAAPDAPVKLPDAQPAGQAALSAAPMDPSLLVVEDHHKANFMSVASGRRLLM